MMEQDDVGAAMDRSIRTTPAMDLTVAPALLLEAKAIMDEMGVVFFLRQGTCLGAIRDNGFIPWDDDIDIGSVIGMHGFSEREIEPVADAFRARGYGVQRGEAEGESWLGLLKNDIRIDWLCLRVRQGHIVHFPGVRFPVRLFEELKEIDFLGEKFLVANPPEEYLTIKYGPDWKTPKKLDYGKDVIENMPAGSIPGHPGRLKQRVMTWLFPRRTARIQVLDPDGDPVFGAKIIVAGWGTYDTNRAGYARFFVPRDDVYALIIRAGDREEVLYEEQLEPGKTFVYRPDPAATSGRIFILSAE
jgi:hypothetical protein